MYAKKNYVQILNIYIEDTHSIKNVPFRCHFYLLVATRYLVISPWDWICHQVNFVLNSEAFTSFAFFDLQTILIRYSLVIFIGEKVRSEAYFKQNLSFFSYLLQDHYSFPDLVFSPRYTCNHSNHIFKQDRPRCWGSWSDKGNSLIYLWVFYAALQPKIKMAV